MWLAWVCDDGDFWKTEEVVTGCEERENREKWETVGDGGRMEIDGGDWDWICVWIWVWVDGFEDVKPRIGFKDDNDGVESV
ncbi:hypothetical protein QYF36_002459 [Acer negundo]|nr:hypothetical protein QYF36_002459 [Acer negundo]